MHQPAATYRSLWKFIECKRVFFPSSVRLAEAGFYVVDSDDSAAE